MRSSIIASMAALGFAATAAADSLVVDNYCYFSCTHNGYFRTDYGSYRVSGKDGCHKTSVPGMTEFCLDHKKDRGHFKFSHQSHKRCLKVTSHTDYDCGIAGCWTTTYREVACSWREAPSGDEEEVATVSLTVDAPAAETPAVGKSPDFVYITPEQAEADGYVKPVKEEEEEEEEE